VLPRPPGARGERTARNEQAHGLATVGLVVCKVEVAAPSARRQPNASVAQPLPRLLLWKHPQQPNHTRPPGRRQIRPTENGPTFFRRRRFVSPGLNLPGRGEGKRPEGQGASPQTNGVPPAGGAPCGGGGGQLASVGLGWRRGSCRLGGSQA